MVHYLAVRSFPKSSQLFGSLRIPVRWVEWYQYAQERREAYMCQLLNTAILTSCVTWFSMLLTPHAPTELLRKPGSRPWLALPLNSEPQDEPLRASVGLARGVWSLGARAMVAPAGLCYRGCPIPAFSQEKAKMADGIRRRSESGSDRDLH